MQYFILQHLTFGQKKILFLFFKVKWIKAPFSVMLLLFIQQRKLQKDHFLSHKLTIWYNAAPCWNQFKMWCSNVKKNEITSICAICSQHSINNFLDRYHCGWLWYLYHGFPYMSSYIYYILTGKLSVKET